MAKRLTPNVLKELTQILQKFQQIQASLTKQNVNMQDEETKQSVLMIACMWSQPGLARRALMLGADIHQTNRLDREPIHIAAIGGNVDIIAMLLDAGAEINKRGGGDGTTPLGFAVDYSHLEAVRFLLAKGANPFVVLDDSGDSCLHMAARNNNVKIAKLLIKAGLENAPDRNGTTPYSLAWRYNAGPPMKRLLAEFLPPRY